MSIDFGLEALTEDFADASITNPDDYQDQLDTPPPDAGNYRFRVDEGAIAMNKDGEPMLDNAGYPQVTLNKLTILEPESHKDQVIFPYQKFSLKPREGGKRPGTRPAIDLLRGFNQGATFANGKEAFTQLAELFSQGETFVAVSDWIGKDSEAIKQFIEENGGDLSEVTEEEKQDFFNKAIIRGQKNFPKLNGKPVGELTDTSNPPSLSGDVVQARANIGRIYPSNKPPKKLGPFKAKK